MQWRLVAIETDVFDLRSRFGVIAAVCVNDGNPTCIAGRVLHQQFQFVTAVCFRVAGDGARVVEDDAHFLALFDFVFFAIKAVQGEGAFSLAVHTNVLVGLDDFVQFVAFKRVFAARLVEEVGVGVGVHGAVARQVVSLTIQGAVFIVGRLKSFRRP